jgi:hypothetical protein
VRTSLWLRVFACSVAFNLGSLLNVQSSNAADDPPVPDGAKQAPASNDADAPLAESGLAGSLLGNLSPEHMKSLGEMLEKDWKDRPEWGDMAIAILKNDFMRPGAGWWKLGAKRYGWSWLCERFDANKDCRISPDEITSDISQADQFFDRFDRDGDGQLTPGDFDYTEPANMNMAVMKEMMSNQLFYQLDKDSNGRVTLEEMAEFFLVADKDELGFVTAEDLRLANRNHRPKPAFRC